MLIIAMYNFSNIKIFIPVHHIFRPIKLRFSQNWFITCFMTGDPHYVPDSCCRYPGDLYNLTNCVGLRDRARLQAPAGGPPVLPAMRNDQLFTQVGLFYVTYGATCITSVWTRQINDFIWNIPISSHFFNILKY